MRTFKKWAALSEGANASTLGQAIDFLGKAVHLLQHDDTQHQAIGRIAASLEDNFNKLFRINLEISGARSGQKPHHDYRPVT